MTNKHLNHVKIIYRQLFHSRMVLRNPSIDEHNNLKNEVEKLKIEIIKLSKIIQEHMKSKDGHRGYRGLG